MQGPSIVVGIDFGTTFSGIAWTIGNSIEDIEVHPHWPGGGNRTSVKVPSTISFSGVKIQWGYQVGQFTEALRGIKLLLDEDQKIEYTPSLQSKALLAKYGKTAEEATALYLKQLIQQAKQVLERRLGLDIDELDTQFILTVPAVWSDKAKDSTMRAAVAAGIDLKNLSLVSEPEAAALYALRAIQPNSIAKDDVFTVCDAGGGTVVSKQDPGPVDAPRFNQRQDLISYQIKSLEPLVLAEVTEGTGAVCGSVLLDGRFDEHLKQKMGLEKYDALKHKSKEAAMTYWQERVKPNFTGHFDDEFGEMEYFIPVAGAEDDESIPIEDGFFMMSSEDVESIFEPIILQIEQLVAQQIAAVGKEPCKTLLLVGGFGASEYLYHRLRTANPGLAILQPPNGWSAIVSGAVHRGLEGNKVESRIARRNYGVECHIKFVPSIHRPDDPTKRWDPLEQTYRVSGMDWYIEKVRRIPDMPEPPTPTSQEAHCISYQSSKVSENKPIRMGFYSSISVQRHKRNVFRIPLYFSHDDVAPRQMTPETMKLCELEADLRVIPEELFDRKKNSDGIEYFRIPFVLKMTPTSASLIFELEFNGVSYGSVRSKY
ncbi:Hsp70 family protein [Aspergillus mulundensis]|uniref:Actin-like ATPase domain-containing protein n=1 Tax=Aspergillus mulundensis TaxID=1810919 RepID=A0A3D8SBS7_9EURO|nr:Uncharacterized protein DSM5745_03967 [Aspergillus mulundensis]RDW83641.1 Uncharacterized protein DSM5745_03967 [Aspergillus mulundensis]